MPTRLNDYRDFHICFYRYDNLAAQVKAYADVMGYGYGERRSLVALYSLCYSLPSSIVMMERMGELEKDAEGFYQRNKDRLIFQSDRKYLKLRDAFPKAWRELSASDVFDWLDSFGGVVDVEKAVRRISRLYQFGRFGSFLLLEAYMAMFGADSCNDDIDWTKGDTVTSGMLHVLGLDKEAELWDREEILRVPVETLDATLKRLQKSIPKADGNSASYMETSLCAYRKLFKGSRYLGYYSDRLLGELVRTLDEYPEHADALGKVFDARAISVPAGYLGEICGWRGIRKEKCKEYQRTGRWRQV